MTREYHSALRPFVRKRLEEIGKADLVVGLPCFNNDGTIAHVLQMVSWGIYQHFRDLKAVIIVADGGSTDDTRDRCAEFQIKPWQEKIITIYRGIGGKGTALRAIFECAAELEVSACVCVDADLRSINPDWIKYLVEPVLEGSQEFVAPIYNRYKYDGTITNNIVYNLVRALYGKRIRQPIGGDFAFDRRLAAHFLRQPVWGSDIARYGIDIWMTTSALVNSDKVCQSNLGVKIHDAKDPADALGPMFRQVCGTLFDLMDQHQEFWLGRMGSEPVPTFGCEMSQEPEPMAVNQERMIREFKEGMRLFGPLWREIFSGEVWAALVTADGLSPEDFSIPIEVWVKLLYELAARHHHLREHRNKLVSLMTPLYLARVASFITRTSEMSSREAEEVVEEQAQAFEDLRPYLDDLWQNHRPGPGLERALQEE
ncbi:MAG: glycosyltransferase [Acidobacteria bacterium]|nr:glycosyltransferase [Acidobacteriota bacterium]